MNEHTLSRRRFVAATGAGALAAIVPGQMKAPTERPDDPPPHPEPPEHRLGYAVVGLGEVATTQVIPALTKCKRSKITAVVTGDPNGKGQAYARELGLKPSNVYDYRTYDRLRDDPDVDVIYIALPNAMHAEYTVRGAQAGKHVLCEKPMANTVDECRQMIDACARAGKRLMIAYRQQYEPYNREVVRMARAGELGELRTIVAVNGQNQGDPNQWRQKLAMAGGGSLVDVGVYCLNAARFVSGEEPVEIVAQSYSDRKDPRFREVEDRIAFSLVFPSGFVANLTSFYSGHGTQLYTLTGSVRRAELNPAFAYHGLRLKVAHRGDRGEVTEQIALEDVDQFANEIDHMSRCIQENRKPHTPGEEGMQDIRIVKAIYEAVQSGRTVRLPAVDRLDAFRGSEPTY